VSPLTLSLLRRNSEIDIFFDSLRALLPRVGR
jgi:hypothetical protein